MSICSSHGPQSLVWSRGKRSSPCSLKSALAGRGQSLCGTRGSFTVKKRKERTMISITSGCVTTSKSHRLGAMKASLWTVSGEVTFSRGADERNPLHGLAFKLGHCVPIWWGVVKPRNVAADVVFFGVCVCVRIYCIIFLPNNRLVRW